MRVFLSILILLTFGNTSFGQAILTQYNFNNGSYYICLLEGPMGKDRGMPVCPLQDAQAFDTTTFFYTSDKRVLNQLKKELILYERPTKNGVSEVFQCGYPFYFCVFKEGRLLLKLPANIECGYMKIASGQKLFHSKTLKNYKRCFIPLKLNYKCFNSAEERSVFIQRIKKDPTYVSIKKVNDYPQQQYFLLETMQMK